MQLTVMFINTFLQNYSHLQRQHSAQSSFKKFVLGWDKMRIDDMNDAQDPYEFEEDAMG